MALKALKQKWLADVQSGQQAAPEPQKPALGQPQAGAGPIAGQAPRPPPAAAVTVAPSKPGPVPTQPQPPQQPPPPSPQQPPPPPPPLQQQPPSQLQQRHQKQQQQRQQPLPPQLQASSRVEQPKTGAAGVARASTEQARPKQQSTPPVDANGAVSGEVQRISPAGGPAGGKKRNMEAPAVKGSSAVNGCVRGSSLLAVPARLLRTVAVSGSVDVALAGSVALANPGPPPSSCHVCSTQPPPKKRREEGARPVEAAGPPPDATVGGTAGPAHRPAPGPTKQRLEKQPSSKEAAGLPRAAKKPPPQAPAPGPPTAEPTAADVQQRRPAAPAAPRPAKPKPEGAAAANGHAGPGAGGRVGSAPAAKVEAGSAGSNPSTSARGAAGGAGSGGGGQQRLEASSARATKVKREEFSSTIGIPLELLASPSGSAERLGDIAVSTYRSHQELVAAVKNGRDSQIPSKPRLVYQDGAGDWMLLHPDCPWKLFVHSAKRLLVVKTP